MLTDVRKALRVSSEHFDDEIQDLIDAAREDMIQSGVSPTKAHDIDDPLIKRALKTYAKAHFGLDNPNAERFQESYDMLKQHLSLAEDYNTEEV